MTGSFSSGMAGCVSSRVKIFSEAEMAELAFPELTTLEALLNEIDGCGHVQVSYEDAMIVSAASFAALKSSKVGRSVTISEILEQKPKTIDYTD